MPCGSRSRRCPTSDLSSNAICCLSEDLWGEAQRTYQAATGAFRGAGHAFLWNKWGGEVRWCAAR